MDFVCGGKPHTKKGRTMKKPKKLTLNQETLRDLMAHNAGDVKGGARKTNGKHCLPASHGTCGYTCNFITCLPCL